MTNSSPALWLKDGVCCFLPGIGDLERRNAVNRLILDPHDIAAGRQDRDAWAEPHYDLGQGRHRLDQVLAIVEHEQEMPVAHAARKKLLAVTRSPPSFSSSTPATADGARASSESDASSTSQAPCSKSMSKSPAAFKARAVFPIPPGPVKVTTR